MAVPGKPGEMGWKLNEMTDGAGNKIQTWCLRPGNGHGGPDFAQRYISAGGATDVWTGACLFAGGINRDNFSFTGNNPANAYNAVTWLNIEPGMNGQMTRDWEFSYNPATGNLSVTKTKTTWNLVGRIQNGVLRFYLVAKSMKDNTVNPNPDTYQAPMRFSNLTFNGNQLTQANAPGTANGAFVAAAVPSGPVTTLSLTNPSFGGNGTMGTPFVGVTDALSAGDMFTVEGTGISNPLVSGTAATAAGGDWMVESWSSSFVTYEDTDPVTVYPGDDIFGFDFYSLSSAIGDSWWLISSNEPSNAMGTVVPAPEPSTFLLLASASAMLTFGAGWTRRSRLPSSRPRS